MLTESNQVLSSLARQGENKDNQLLIIPLIRNNQKFGNRKRVNEHCEVTLHQLPLQNDVAIVDQPLEEEHNRW